MSVVIAPGTRVRLHFRLALADGTAVEETGEEPFAFTVGDGQLAEGLERCLLGLRAGDRGRFEIEPLDEFGRPGEAVLEQMPRSEFTGAPEPGAVIAFAGPAGEEVPGTIVEVTDDEVVVDFAHPLAGHALVFEIEILEVTPDVTGS